MLSPEGKWSDRVDSRLLSIRHLGLLDEGSGGGGLVVERCPLPRIFSEVGVLPEHLQVSLSESRELPREPVARGLQVAPSPHPCRSGPDHEEQREQEGSRASA